MAETVFRLHCLVGVVAVVPVCTLALEAVFGLRGASPSRFRRRVWCGTILSRLLSRMSVPRTESGCSR